MSSTRTSLGAASAAVAVVLFVVAILCLPTPPPPPRPVGPPSLHAVPDPTGLFEELGIYLPVVVAVPDGGFLMLLNDDFPDESRLFGSPDGVTWTELADGDGPPAAALLDIAATPDAVVVLGLTAAGEWSTITGWRSRDGEAWERIQDAGMFAAMGAGSVAGGAPGFVAIGGFVEDTESGSAAIGSTDGARWVRMQVPEPFERVHGVGVTDAGFVAFGYDGERGHLWRREADAWAPLPIDMPIVTSYAAHRETGIALGGTFERVRSPDGHLVFVVGAFTQDGGRTWLRGALPFQDMGDATAVAIPDGYLVLASPEEIEQRTSLWWCGEDGAFRRLPLDLGDGEAAFELHSVVWDSERLLVVGSSWPPDTAATLNLWIADR